MGQSGVARSERFGKSEERGVSSKKHALRKLRARQPNLRPFQTVPLPAIPTLLLALQKFLRYQARCQHYRVDIAVFDPGVASPMVGIAPELLNPFSEGTMR